MWVGGGEDAVMLLPLLPTATGYCIVVELSFERTFTEKLIKNCVSVVASTVTVTSTTTVPAILVLVVGATAPVTNRNRLQLLLLLLLLLLSRLFLFLLLVLLLSGTVVVVADLLGLEAARVSG